MLHSLLIIFVVSVCLSALLTRVVRNLATSRGWVDQPDSSRHIHLKPVPRLGGVAIFLAFICMVGIGLLVRKWLGPASLFSMRMAARILIPAGLVFGIGLYDDLRSLGAYPKFGVQILAACLLYLHGFGIQQFDLFREGHALSGVLGLPLTIVWVLLITNAFNLVDGLDGLAAGSALFSTMVFLAVSLFGGARFEAFLAVVLAGVIVGFLRFNFSPASIFLGDSGSLFIGFLLSALALAGSQKAPTMVAVAIPVVCFGLPVLDVAVAVLRRFLSGRPLFKGDREHIHHKLLKLGLSQRDAVLILYGVSALFGFLSLTLLHGGGAIAFVLVVLGVGVAVGIPRLRYQEFLEVGRVFERTVSQKQIITNNLYIRRAVESLCACEEMSELCRILVGALQPIGFDGFSLRIPPVTWSPQLLPPPLTRNLNGELSYSWPGAGAGAAQANWELKLELVNEAGDKCGFFSVCKRLTGKPLLVDINLLGDDFHAALAGAVHRALAEAHASALGSSRDLSSDAAQAVSA